MCVFSRGRTCITFFGIPSNGMSVSNKSGEERIAYNSCMSALRRSPEDTSPLDAATKIIRSYVGQRNRQDEGAFKQAFVVHVLYFLVGSSLINYWPALTDPDAIKNYDWASCFMDAMFESLRSPVGKLTPGAKLFMQVRILIDRGFFICKLPEYGHLIILIRQL